MRNLFIYLSGSIQKSHKTENFSVWTDAHIEKMTSLFKERGINVVFLNPASRSDDLSDSQSIFGRDLLQVCLSHCVLVDGRDKRGIGVGYEMAIANSKGIPVFSWVPYSTHYYPKEMSMLGQNLKDWQHPFMHSPSVKLIENLEEAVSVISTYLFRPARELNEEDFILPAIQHYIRSNLVRDKEMNEMINKYVELQSKTSAIFLI